MRYFTLILAGILLQNTALAAVLPLQTISQPKTGGYVQVSGDCGTGSAATFMPFALEQNYLTVKLTAADNQINSDNKVLATVTIPATAESGLAALTGNCGNGNTISSVIVIAPSLPDGSIIKTNEPTVYLIFGGRKYGITSMEVFNRLGLSIQNIKIMNQTELQSYPSEDVLN